MTRTITIKKIKSYKDKEFATGQTEQLTQFSQRTARVKEKKLLKGNKNV